MNEVVGYRERRSSRLPATIWTRRSEPGLSMVRPDGCMDLIWNGSRLFIAGPDTAPHPYRARRSTTLTAIRLAPGVAPVLLGLPASELRDQRVDLADVSSAMAARWEDSVAGAVAPGVVLETLAVGALAFVGGVPGWIGPTVRAVRVGTPVSEIAERLGVSSRHLRRRCADQFGYGPKALQRILRADDATRSLASGVRLTDAAHRHGYADYSHMFRELRAVAGAPPAAFVRPQTPDEDNGAQRSTGLPSGSSTTAYRWPQAASNGGR